MKGFGGIRDEGGRARGAPAAATEEAAAAATSGGTTLCLGVTACNPTGSEGTAQQQPQEQQQQYLETKEQSMVVDSGKNMVECETGETGWLDSLIVKLNYEPYLSCSMVPAAAEPIAVRACFGIGTR